MINFIIYEDDNEWIKQYLKITHRFMGKNDNLYKIYTHHIKELIYLKHS